MKIFSFRSSISRCMSCFSWRKSRWNHKTKSSHFDIWAPSSESVSSSIPSWQILTAHAQPFRGARDLAFCLKVPLDSLLVWVSSEGSGKTAWMRRLVWTFVARIGDKYQIRSMRSICSQNLTDLPPHVFFFQNCLARYAFRFKDLKVSSSYLPMEANLNLPTLINTVLHLRTNFYLQFLES